MTTPPSGAATTQSFDGNGNLTLQNTDGALTAMSWDGENRLTSVVSASGTEAYSYSTDGLRQKKVTPSGTTNLVWDGANVLQERDASLVKLAQYTHFPGFWGGRSAIRKPSFGQPCRQGRRHSRPLNPARYAPRSYLSGLIFGRIENKRTKSAKNVNINIGEQTLHRVSLPASRNCRPENTTSPYGVSADEHSFSNSKRHRMN